MALAAEGAEGPNQGPGDDAGPGVDGAALRAGHATDVPGDEKVSAMDRGVAGPAEEGFVGVAVEGGSAAAQLALLLHRCRRKDAPLRLPF